MTSTHVKASELTRLKIDMARRDLREAVTKWAKNIVLHEGDDTVSAVLSESVSALEKIAIEHGRNLERESRP